MAQAIYTGTPNPFAAVTVSEPPMVPQSVQDMFAKLRAQRQAEAAAFQAAIDARTRAAQADLARRIDAASKQATIGRGDPRVDLVASGQFVRPVKRQDIMAPAPTAAQLAYANAPTDSWGQKCMPPARLENRDGWMQCSDKPSRPPQLPRYEGRTGGGPIRSEANVAPPARMTFQSPEQGLHGFWGTIGKIGKAAAGVATGLIPGTIDDKLVGALIGSGQGGTGKVPTSTMFGCGGPGQLPCPGGFQDATPGVMTPGEQSVVKYSGQGYMGMQMPHARQIRRLQCPTFPNGKTGVLWQAPMTGQIVCLPRGTSGRAFGLVRLHKPATKPPITGGDMNAIKRASRAASRLAGVEKDIKKLLRAGGACRSR